MGEEIYQHWANDDRIEIIHILDDIGQPYSCSSWGATGEVDIPPIIDDGSGYTIFDWFVNPNTPAGYPLIIFIDHTMTVFRIMGTLPSLSYANIIIETMMDMMPDMSITDAADFPFINNFNITRLYPNPFNPILNIKFDITLSGVIQLDILDISGAHIETLYSGFIQPGSHEMQWNAESIASGAYLVSLNFENQNHIEKVVFLK